MNPEMPKPHPKETASLGAEERARAWRGILKAGVHAQRLVPGAVCVGGTAAALYAEHRISHDTDHVLTTLRDCFQEVRAALESRPERKTARVSPPVLILGSLENVEVGFRQLRRSHPIETQMTQTEAGPLTVPTLDEMICMKAFLAYDRNATRDYLDFAALSECSSEDFVVNSLLKLDERYGELQTASVGLETAKRLCAAAPYDLNELELTRYKGLKEKWTRWETTRELCQKFGALLGEALVLKGK